MGQAIDAKKMNKVMNKFSRLKDIKPDWISEEDYEAIKIAKERAWKEVQNEIDRQNTNL